MNKGHLQEFNDSFERCIASPLFLDRFYEKFTSSSEEVAKKFTSTNMDVQKRMLLKSLAYMMLFNTKPEVLSSIAIKHNKEHLDIEPHLYSIWLECMIETVKETDIYFNEGTEDAWLITLQQGIDYMIGKYEGS